MTGPSIDHNAEGRGFSPGSKLSNEALIEGITSGNRVAAKQFHDTYSANISRMVWRLLGGDHHHEDVVQQVLVSIISNMRTIRKPQSLDAWIKSVTLRVVRDELRSRKRRNRFFSPSAIVDEDQYPDPNRPWKSSRIEYFYNILEKMSADDRIILVLKYLEGWSNEEIATLRRFSLSTAKRRLERARTRFLNMATSDHSLLSFVENPQSISFP